MSLTTDIRHALRDALTDVDGEARVALGRSDYDAGRGTGFDEINFLVRIHLGEATEANEAKLDAMIDASDQASIKGVIERDAGLGDLCADVFVSRCSGQQLYGDDHVLGAEWTVRVKKGD